MAFILVKGPIANLNGICERIRERGLSTQYLNMAISFPPHDARILSPYIFEWFAERFEPEFAASPCVICIYDPYDCIPLADGRFITNSKLFFDDPGFFEYFTSANAISNVRFSTCPAIPKSLANSISCVQTGPIQPGLICAHCGKTIDGPYGTHEIWGGGEEIYCIGCHYHNKSITVHGPAELLNPESPIAKFLLEHMEQSFVVDILLLPHVWQTVFLIGSSYYISSVPIPAAVYNRLYKGRQRLRMTARVVRHLFGEEREREKKKRPVNVRAIFDEFVSDLK